LLRGTQGARLLRIWIEAPQFFTMAHQEVDQQTSIRRITVLDHAGLPRGSLYTSASLHHIGFW
jgi:hypothetical protein